jgi:molybdopterin converting factor subunit 1
MHIDIQYFAVLSATIGCKTESIDVADDATVAAVLDALAEKHAIIDTMRTSLAAAVDTTYVPPQHILHAGDTLSIIPPVSGG